MSEATKANPSYTFGDWTVEPAMNRLSKGETTAQVERLTMDVLIYLLERPGLVVSVDELLSALWGGRHGDPGMIQKRIAHLRQVLSDDSRHPEYIETIRTRGYRTIAPVGNQVANGPSSVSQSSDQAELIERLYSSIAVLPLDNRTGESELESVAEQIAESVADSLARLGYISGGLRLIALRETRRFKDDDASEIAQAFEVGGILRGTLRKSGNRIRISMELANTGGEQVWRDVFDEPLEEVLNHQERLVHKIVAGFLGAIDRYGPDRVAKLPAESLGPIGLLLKADAASRPSDAEAFRESRELMERAIELDPNFPMAKAVLANRIAFAVASGASTDREADCQRAFELADESSASESAVVLMHAGLAFSALRHHDRAVAVCQLAHEMAPRYMPITWALASAHLYAGRPQEALRLYQEAQLQAPSGARSSRSTGIVQCQLAMGDVDAAVKTAQKAIDQGVRDVDLYVVLASALGRADHIDDAIEAVNSARRLVPRFTISKGIRALHRRFGNEEVASRITRGLHVLLDRGYD